MTWQDPMNDTQQKETRRLISKQIDALIPLLRKYGMDAKRIDMSSFVVDGMKFTASDQISDIHNGVCYITNEFNQMFEITDYKLNETADSIYALLSNQVEKQYRDFKRSINDTIRELRNKWLR